jgi:hypothetical protein
VSAAATRVIVMGVASLSVISKKLIANSFGVSSLHIDEQEGARLARET